VTKRGPGLAEYRERLHPAIAKGQWRKKLGAPRLDPKPGGSRKRLTQSQVHARAKKVVKALGGGRLGDRRSGAGRLPVGGRWTRPGTETLVYSSGYRDETAEVIRRAASKVGWERAAIVDEVEAAMRSDHNGRLRFRDETREDHPPPTMTRPVATTPGRTS